MKLLNSPLTRDEERSLLDMLKGNIARVAVSDNEEEIVSSLGFAIDRLSMLAYSRIKEIKSGKNNVR